MPQIFVTDKKKSDYAIGIDDIEIKVLHLLEEVYTVKKLVKKFSEEVQRAYIVELDFFVDFYKVTFK